MYHILLENRCTGNRLAYEVQTLEELRILIGVFTDTIETYKSRRKERGIVLLHIEDETLDLTDLLLHAKRLYLNQCEGPFPFDKFLEAEVLTYEETVLKNEARLHRASKALTWGAMLILFGLFALRMVGGGA